MGQFFTEGSEGIPADPVGATRSFNAAQVAETFDEESGTPGAGRRSSPGLFDVDPRICHYPCSMPGHNHPGIVPGNWFDRMRASQG